MLGAAALIFFGPEQLPKVARKVGLVVREVQNTSQSFIREMEAAAEPAHDISRAHLLDEPFPANGTASAEPHPAEPHPAEPHPAEPHPVEPHVAPPVDADLPP